MLKDIITADQLSLVISQAAAPAFLLGAVAAAMASALAGPFVRTRTHGQAQGQASSPASI